MMDKLTTKKEFLSSYDSYAESILKHIYFRVGSKELAEDLTQETFFKAWNNIADNNKKIDNFKFFVYKIANNLIIDHYRKKARAPISLDDIHSEKTSIDPVQEKEAENTINRIFLEKCLLELDKTHRQIMVYRYINDFSIKEISEITKKSESNISVIIHRGIKFLRERMAKKYENK